MSTVGAKRFEFEAAVDRAGRISAASDAPVDLSSAWTPEHLLLAALCRCTLASLAYHARRASIDVAANASASGVVTKRTSDGRYAFVEIEARFDVDLDPAPRAEEVEALLAKAERDCYVSASLVIDPVYRWRVNGEDVT